ncbi:MAG: hypothetical protein QXR45_12830 [Candidatus Bathyarchaeia archaeon]
MGQKSLILIFAIIYLIGLSLFFAFNSNVQNQEAASTTEGSSTPNPTPEEDTFVVPEVPLGILGSISALVMALGIFALIQKIKI